MIRKGVAIAIAGGSAVAGVLGLVLLKAVLRDAPRAQMAVAQNNRDAVEL